MNSVNEVFEFTTDAVFGTDKYMRVRFWNRYCEELFNIDQTQAIGRTCYELVCGKDLHGNEFCREGCQISKHHDRFSPNKNWDLVVRRHSGEYAVVNVGSYYTGNAGESDDECVQVFHSMRVIDCFQLIRRLSFNSGTALEDNSNISRLSRREYEVLRQVSSGLKTKSIAQKLGISPATVRNHVKNIYSKLEVHSQAEAINCAMRQGLI